MTNVWDEQRNRRRGIFSRLLDNLIGWPALERTPLGGVISPIEGMDDVVERWRRSFFEGVHDASPPDTTASADGSSVVGGGGSPAEDVTVPPAGEPQPEDGWEDDGLDEERRLTFQEVWERRDANANLKVDKFGDVYEDPAIPADRDPHLTIAEVYVHIDDLSEQVHEVVHENLRLKSELNQAIAQLRIARQQRDDHLAKLKRLQQNR